MCGIAGILNTDNPLDLSTVQDMINAQKHRGPDASLVKSYPKAVLGFARLSIIDLSIQAMQPMESIDGRHILVFNGEIYNYKELRKELNAQYHFRSESDSEVLLAAYQRWGEDCLGRLNGMFAFCIYDRADGSAFFARDRFGQKSLLFTQDGQRLLFASEIKPLLVAGIRAKPNLKSWSRYLAFASYDDSDDTFFDNIYQLRPGESMRFKPGFGITRNFYYRLGEHIKPINIDVGEAAGEIRNLMIDVGRIHMRADVPVAVSLSGGFDSASLLASLSIAGEIHAGLKCFSIEFEKDLSERPWIEATSRYHNLPGQIDLFTEQQFQNIIRPMMWQFEGPIGGLMNCGISQVMQAARKGGFIVVQNGNGLDECFAGYRNFHALYVKQLLQSHSPKAEDAVKAFARNWGVDEEKVLLSAKTDTNFLNTAIDGTISIHPELLHPDVIERGCRLTSAANYTGDPLRDLLVDYLQVSKIPRNTRMYDRLSMAYGLELRLSFLDHRLVEFGLSLPKDYYFLYGRSKSIVREAFAGDMDEEVRVAAKHSIQCPQGVWLRRQPMCTYIRELLKSQSFADRKLFSPSKALKAFDEFCDGKYDNSFFIWQMINMEEWFRIFIDQDPVSNPLPLCEELCKLRPLQNLFSE